VSTISVRQAHSLPIEQAKKALGGFESDLTSKGVKLVWNGAQAEIKGTGVSGEVKVTASDVQVVVKLGMLAKAAGVKADLLEKSITKRLATAFAAPAS
jgi:putative polyhydroxyalkanoate system protein